jgi:hypothetical protein
LFHFTFSSIQTLLNYYSTTLTARNNLGTERDGWNLWDGRTARWLRLGRIGNMNTGYGSTHDGWKEIDLFIFVMQVLSEGVRMDWDRLAG